MLTVVLDYALSLSYCLEKNPRLRGCEASCYIIMCQMATCGFRETIFL